MPRGPLFVQEVRNPLCLVRFPRLLENFEHFRDISTRKRRVNLPPLLQTTPLRPAGHRGPDNVRDALVRAFVILLDGTIRQTFGDRGLGFFEDGLFEERGTREVDGHSGRPAIQTERVTPFIIATRVQVEV